MSYSMLSQYDLYFFTQLAVAAIEPHDKGLDRFLTARFGKQWLADLRRLRDQYRASVEKVMTELNETTQAVAGVAKLLARIGPWRRLMEGMARSAEADKRNLLLQAAGYGLGSPEGIKATKDFLLEVKVRLDLHGKDFLALGCNPAALRFPAETLAALERQSETVSRERAEDAQEREGLRRVQRELVNLLDGVELAARNASQEALLFADDAALQGARAAELGLQQALAEARVRSVKASQDQAVPVELTTTTAASTVTGTTTGTADTDG